MPTFVLRAIDPELWARVQAKAAAEGLPVKALILKAVAQYVARPVLVLLLLITALAAPLAAQTPAAVTAEQLRVQIAQLELQLATLRDQLRVVQPTTGLAPPQTLADAAAAAALVPHAWPRSTNTAAGAPTTNYRPDQADPTPGQPSRALSAIATEDDTTAVSEPTTHVILNTEAQWKGRRAELESALTRDTLLVAAMRTRVVSLDADVATARDRDRRAVIELERQQAETELARLRALTAADAREITALEEQGRRAKVPPGWLRP